MKYTYKRYSLLFLLACLSVSQIKAQSLEDACLKNHNVQQGRFALQGTCSKIVGSAFLGGKSSPDIFISNDRKETRVSLVPFVEYSKDGIPVFGKEKPLILPIELSGLNTLLSVYQSIEGQIFLVGYYNRKIYLAQFDVVDGKFNLMKSCDYPIGLKDPLSIQARVESNQLHLFAGVASSEYKRPPENEFTNEFYAYDGAGIYRGKLNKVGLYELTYPADLESSCLSSKLITPSDSEVYLNFISTSLIDKSLDEKRLLFAGSWYGAISYYTFLETNGILSKRKYIVNIKGDPIRHPGHSVSPLAYPNAAGNLVDIVAAGFGGIYYYKYISQNQDGTLVYDDPKPLLQSEADLATGAYASPTVIDWDGDGILDIVTGNAQGYIEFLKNAGTNDIPTFENGVRLVAGKSEIHIQPGYAESNYGPEYARLGFVGANVIDWDGDGVLDIMTNDGRGRHTVFIGRQTEEKVKLRKGYPLYLKGLELRGTWRCRPAVGLLDGKMAYITLDDDDELHLYWKMDAYNVTDGGKLYLRSLKKISANYLKSIGTGRIKIELTDWDNDGKKDLLIGAAANTSIPDALTGLPYNRQNEGKGSSILFLRNVNTNKTPIYDFPVELKYKNHLIQLGDDECSPVATVLGGSYNGLSNLLVGSCDGRFYLLKRSDISQ